MDEAQRPSRVDTVIAAVRRRIAGRSLAPGGRLPSIRKLAAALSVSPSTVVEAYERLVAEGAVRARPGSGFYVAGPPAPLSLAQAGPRVDRAVDPFWVSRQSLDAGSAVAKPGCGWLPADWLPAASLRKALRGLARADAATLGDYGSPLGLPALRGLIARRMEERNVACPPDRVMLTESGTQALDVLCRLLLEPGDAVLVDDPCYFNFQALLRAHRVRVVGVPYTPTGPDLALFAEALAAHRPRLYVTNAAIHNPTGAALSPVTAHRLLTLAEQAGLIVVEDEIFGDFERQPAPRLAAFDGLDRVVLVGSFSKTVSAAARCGFVAARPDWIERLIDLRIATAFGGGRLDSELVHAVLADGGYRRHMEALRARLADAMADVAARLRAAGIVPWLMPSGGMFLWCRLPDGVDGAALARAAIAEDLVLAPGNAFSVAQTAGAYMRFNVSQTGDGRVFDALQRALDRTRAP